MIIFVWIILKVPVNAIRQNKQTKGIRIGKGKYNFHYSLLKLINAYISPLGTSFNIQKIIHFYTNIIQIENETFKIHHLQ